MRDVTMRNALSSRFYYAFILTIATTAVATLVFAITAGDAHALTLREALISTYSTNPSLAAARARLDATKELLARAKARGRPNMFASGEVNYGREYSGRS